jgi:hypothetical protein
MKSNKLMIASLLILVGMGAITVSCRKEKANFRKADLMVDNGCERTGGDEDPIIRVRVKKKNTFVAVDSAYVETMTYSTNVRANFGYTNTLGELDQQVATGIYYLKVTVPGYSTPYVTDTMHVSKDIQATVLVD